MGCNNTTQATYRVLSVPGGSRTAEPSGPARVAFDALLAAGHINGDLGNGAGNPAGYTAVNTPYGQGYLGTPTSKPYYAMQPSGSPYASASPAPIQTNASQTGTPISQQLGSSPYSALTSSNAAANTLQQALQPTTPKNPPQVIVPGAPSIGFIYAQQHVVSRSSSVMLSWTTLNMKQGSCAVSLNNQKLATGEEGTKSITASSLPTGSLVFILTCTAANGTPFSKSETVTVQ